MRPAHPIEIFHGGRWHPAARLELQGRESRTDPTWLEYDPEYVADHLGATDRRALSCRIAVDYRLHSLPTFPAFAGDLMPQGEARRSLEARLRRDGQAASDWSVLGHGARNAVGNLRVAHAAIEMPSSPGFSREDVIERGDAFREWAESERIPMEGSSDTGGASPKLLLTEDREGRLHADGVLPDTRAARHFIVKFARGRSRRDAQVLAHEPAYLELARRFGVRCGAPLVHDRGALFVPRFDRVVVAEGIERAGLESLYSLAGIVEPGARLAWESVCADIARAVDDPEDAMMEIVRREALSLAFGDPDNHGRNTSILKAPDGGVTLSPLYDFAPMFLDPELVKRTTLWRSERPGEPPDWRDVAAALEPWVPRERLVPAMRELGAQLEDAARDMRELDVEGELVTRCEPWIRQVSLGLREVR